MTVEECLAGVTREAARALGLLAETGTLEAGKWADLAIWDVERPAELVYRMGFNPLQSTHLEGSVTEFVLKPGSASLADWRAIYRGAVPVLDPACKPLVMPQRRGRGAHRGARRAGLRHQHRLREARQRAHRGGRSRNPAAQHRAQPCRRRRRSHAASPWRG